MHARSITRRCGYPPLRRPGVILLSVSIVAFLSCNRFVDSLRPFSPSTVTVTGHIIDGVSQKPVKNAGIIVVDGDISAVTDSEGLFHLRNVTTGDHELRITASGYDMLESGLDVTLDTPRNSYYLNRTNLPPKIESVFIDTADRKFLEDTLTLTFSATDSTGGIIAVALSVDDSLSPVEKEIPFTEPVFSVHDSFTLCGLTAGKHTATLRIVGAGNDTTADTVTFDLSKPRKPSFALLRTGTEGFIVGKPGYLQIAVTDADSVVTHITIDWGDGSEISTSFALQGTYWHSYTDEQPAAIIVSVFTDDAVIDSTLNLDVLRIDPPLLDNNLRFIPSQYLAPHDSTLLIVVRVLEIKDDWVKQIIWIVNENDPSAFAYHRDTLSMESGAVSDTTENMFFHEFPTAQFKGTNIVEVRVVDGDDNSSTVSGTFFIAGKGN